MKLYQWANQKIKYFSLIDVKLIALAGMFLGLILAKLFPMFSRLNIEWFIGLTVLCLVRPYYIIFSRKK